MDLLITICARGGSKGIPGKNIKPVNGVPLIGYTIRTAQEFASGKRAHIALSTDDEHIREVAASFGLHSDYKRPAKLASDRAGKLSAISDLLNYEENVHGQAFEFVLDLDVTSPLRTCEDLEKSFELLSANPAAWNIFSVNPASRSPYFNMVEKKDTGYFSLVCQPSTPKLTRQESPKVYDMNASFYFYRRSFFDTDIASAVTDKSLIYIMPHICFDLDEPIDFDFLSYLLTEDKLEFKLAK